MTSTSSSVEPACWRRFTRFRAETFAAPVTVPGPDVSGDLALADLDADGWLDADHLLGDPRRGARLSRGPRRIRAGADAHPAGRGAPPRRRNRRRRIDARPRQHGRQFVRLLPRHRNGIVHGPGNRRRRPRDGAGRRHRRFRRRRPARRRARLRQCHDFGAGTLRVGRRHGIHAGWIVDHLPRPAGPRPDFGTRRRRLRRRRRPGRVRRRCRAVLGAPAQCGGRHVRDAARIRSLPARRRDRGRRSRCRRRDGCRGRRIIDADGPDATGPRRGGVASPCS